MLVEWFACFRFGKSFYSLFGSSFVISEVRLLQGTDGLTDSLEPLEVGLTVLFIFVRNLFYLQISFISLSDRDLLLRTLSDPNLGLPPPLSKVPAKRFSKI